MITVALTWLKSKYAGLVAILAAIGAVVLRMQWLKRQRDASHKARDRAEQELEAAKAHRAIEKEIQKDADELKRKQAKRRREENSSNERDSLDNDW